MKRLTAVLLVLILLSGVLSISAYAASEEKLSDELKSVLLSVSNDELIDVEVSVDYSFGGLEAYLIAYDYADRTTGIERYNFKSKEEQLEYYRVFNIKLNELISEQVLSVMEDMGVTYDDVASYYHQSYFEENAYVFGVPKWYSLTKERIERLADAEEVVSVGLAGNMDQRIPWPYLWLLTRPYSDDPAEKTTKELRELLSTLSDSDEVWVWVNADPGFMTHAQVNEKTTEICGKPGRGAARKEEVTRWIQTRNQLIQQDQTEKVASLMEELSLTADNVFVQWESELERSVWPKGFILTKAKILEAIQNSKIKGIAIYTGQNYAGSSYYPVNPEGKISDRLRAKFNVVSEDQKLEIWLSTDRYYDTVAAQQMKEEAAKECGFALDEAKNIVQVMRWYSVFNKLFFTDRHSKVMDLVEKLGIEETDILEEWSASDIKCAMPTKLSLTKPQIEQMASAAAELDEVKYLDLYTGQDIVEPEPEEATEEMPYGDFTGEAFFKGDADDDFVISVIDATLIQKKLASLSDDPDGVISRNGDVTGDGLDVIDAVLIQKKLAGFEDTHDIGTPVILP